MNDKYQLLVQQARSLLANENDAIANAANLASLIFNHVGRLNWAGFYFYKEKELVLGPFSGQVACTRIPVGKGVCGTAYLSKTTQLVSDVHSFEGHIACDAASESEIVVPFAEGDLSGVLDIDSPEKGRFGEEERWLFEELAAIYCGSIAESR